MCIRDRNYTLVAIPKKGYKCDWFIHQVTVNDADVKDCQITCELDNNVPQSDGETPQPPVVPDEMCIRDRCLKLSRLT